MKRNMGVFSVLIIVFMTSACFKKAALPPPPPPPETILGDTGADNLRESLFKGDQAVLSDQDIARILGTQLRLNGQHRLAILNLGSTRPWSPDIADMEAKNFDDFLHGLKSSPQLTEVRLLPSLLVPEKRTVPYLREAAARIQADLLFVYSAQIQVFQRNRVFKSDEVHAQCVAESVLLDVRTGIIAHTARATEEIGLKKTSADFNFGETIARAESEARGRALRSLGNALTSHLAEQAK